MATVLRGVKLRCKKILELLAPELYRFVRKRYYLRAVRSFCSKDEPDLEVVRHLVNLGDHVVDIGANIGGYTRVLSVFVGSRGHVYSIEPFPSTYETLAYNTRQLRLRNVDTINAAVSDNNGSVHMVLPSDLSGTETHYRASVITSGSSNILGQNVAVPSITVDAKFGAIAPEIIFIKCDVEGHELECLLGAKEFLEKTKCAWLIEVSGDPDLYGSKAQKVFELLCQKKYTVWWYNGKKLKQRQHGDRSVNYFFLREEHINLLKKGDGRCLVP